MVYQKKILKNFLKKTLDKVENICYNMHSSKEQYKIIFQSSQEVQDMNKEQMTVHRALAELKVIDDRIFKAINAGTYVTANKHSNDKINGITIDKFKDNMKSAHQKVTDLINRRNAIKRAVVLSNAVTKITVGDIEYTVAEAIEMKNHGMEFKQQFVKVMNAQLTRANSEVYRNSGEMLEEKAEKYILAFIQAQPKDSKMTANDDTVKALRKDYIERNTFDLVDPLDIAMRIDTMQDEIDEFNAEVDAALSVSNATTVIEFEY